MTQPDPHHPITDLDARFAATVPEHTHRLIEALRRAGVCFDVTVNGPRDDPDGQAYDIFWFQSDADHDLIGQVLRDTIPEDSK